MPNFAPPLDLVSFLPENLVAILVITLIIAFLLVLFGDERDVLRAQFMQNWMIIGLLLYIAWCLHELLRVP